MNEVPRAVRSVLGKRFDLEKLACRGGIEVLKEIGWLSVNQVSELLGISQSR